jgi:hypothetical protein
MLWRLLIIAVLFQSRHAVAADAPQLQTLSPTATKDLDRNENGKPDGYEESFQIDKEFSVRTHERLDEASGAMKGRLTSLFYRDREIWHETYLPELKERFTTVAPNCPFQIGMVSHDKSGEMSASFLDDNNRLVAALVVSKKDGRYAPLTSDEIDRLENLGKAIGEFAKGILDDADEMPTVEPETPQ